MADRTLYQWFADSVRHHPDEPALELAGRALTYHELHRSAEALARRVLAGRAEIPARIALLSTRSCFAYAGYLAIQRLGAAVVPLNPEHPAERIVDIVQRAEASVVLSENDFADTFAVLPARFRPSVITPGDESDAERLPPVPSDASGEAYVLFTSGSTGQPKAVPIRHRNLSAYLEYNIARFGIVPGTRCSQNFGLTFDASVSDMFVTWGGGGTVVVPSRSEMLDPIDFARRRRLTHWHSTPSAIRMAVRLGLFRGDPIITLRHSIFGGEPVTADHAELWRQVAPRSEIYNLYGPTELTITCTDHHLPVDERAWRTGRNGSLPIGRIYPHLESAVLDAYGLPAAEGELCVRGPQRFDGYLDPRENLGRFLAFDGTGAAVPLGDGRRPEPQHWYRTGDRVRRDGDALIHCGRMDHQVKILGHRVEPGEVEAVIRRSPLVTEVAVVAVDHDGEKVLAALCTGQQAAEEQLIPWLRERLPTHMIPMRIQHSDKLPLNENGKLDRRLVRSMLSGANLP